MAATTTDFLLNEPPKAVDVRPAPNKYMGLPRLRVVGVTAVFAITIVNFILIIVALIRPTPNFGSGLFSISTVRSASLTSRSLPAEKPPIAEVPPLRGRRDNVERNSRKAHVVARAQQYWITIGPYTQCHEEADWTLCVGWDDLKASWVPLGTTVVGYTRTTTVQNKNGDGVIRTFVSTLSADAGRDMPGYSMHKPSGDEGEAAVRTVANAASVDGSEVPATLRTLTRTRGKQDDVPTSKARTKTKKTKQTAKMTGNDGGSTRTRWTTTTMSTTSKTTLRPGETGIGSSKTTSKPNSPSNGSKGNSTAVAFEGLWVGALGACVKTWNNPRYCSSPSLMPDNRKIYNQSGLDARLLRDVPTGTNGASVLITFAIGCHAVSAGAMAVGYSWSLDSRTRDGVRSFTDTKHIWPLTIVFFANLVAVILLIIASLILKNIFKNAANTVQTGDPRLTAGGGSSTGLVTIVLILGIFVAVAVLWLVVKDLRSLAIDIIDTARLEEETHSRHRRARKRSRTKSLLPRKNRAAKSAEPAAEGPNLVPRSVDDLRDHAPPIWQWARNSSDAWRARRRSSLEAESARDVARSSLETVQESAPSWWKRARSRSNEWRNKCRDNSNLQQNRYMQDMDTDGD